MRKAIPLFALFVTAALIFSSCASSMITALHDPIQPSSSQQVTYEITAESSEGIKRIELYETINTINSSASVTAGTETLLRTWNVSGNPNSHTVTFTKSTSPGSNRLIDYRIVVTNGDNEKRTSTVTYSTRPYPMPNVPAPVYVRGHPDDVFDAVLIPDTDIDDMDDFRDECKDMIANTVYREPTMKLFNHQFNFYINPERGTATDFDDIGTDGTHQLPSNNSNLAFAEVRVLMHQEILRDYAMSGGIFSTEMDRPQTFIHEAGHAMFSLRDEYCTSNCNPQSTIPNVFSSRADAEAAAPDYGKTASDVKRTCSSSSATDCFKICEDDCPMISGPALFFDYDRPCEDRTIYEILNNAIN